MKITAVQKFNGSKVQGQTPAVEPRDALPQVRCYGCHKRLFDGFLFGIINCPRCKTVMKMFAKEDLQAYNSAKQG